MSDTFNSSVGSSKVDGKDDNIETTRIKHNVKEQLKSRIFLGRYLERRLINPRLGYRDIVVLSPAETELKRDLMDAQYKLHLVCTNYWIGITDTEALGYKSQGVCLWTEIENQPFGPFWFQIKSVKFRDQEVIITLKCLRHISEGYLEIEPILTGGTKNLKESSEAKAEANMSVVSLNETYTEIVGNLKNALSITNVKEFFTFLFAFVIALFTGSTAFVNFLGNFILALVREMSILIKNSTPILLGVLDFFSKIVGGFYILLAMFFRQSTPVSVNPRSIPYERQIKNKDHSRPHYGESFD